MDRSERKGYSVEALGVRQQHPDRLCLPAASLEFRESGVTSWICCLFRYLNENLSVSYLSFTQGRWSPRDGGVNIIVYLLSLHILEWWRTASQLFSARLHINVKQMCMKMPIFWLSCYCLLHIHIPQSTCVTLCCFWQNNVVFNVVLEKQRQKCSQIVGRGCEQCLGGFCLSV